MLPNLEFESKRTKERANERTRERKNERTTERERLFLKRTVRSFAVRIELLDVVGVELGAHAPEGDFQVHACVQGAKIDSLIIIGSSLR